MVCYRERTKIKISKYKKYVGQSPGELKSKLPVESHEQFLLLPTNTCDNIYDAFPTREAHLSLGV